ncbi:mechanosensitive ion channel family protein [Paenibacillus spiritus]|uniref:Mechanosensitive ion channel family protein n=1 Tax=Paenibacillus spiritus TaxID=2496557 RepID=A0A5J5GB92_9BACL|nr:mechanosensitive ion channel family protein [Paenibacillus spiritus]
METLQDTVDQAVTFKDRIWNWVTDADMWANVLFAGIRIIVIFLLTRLIIKIVYGLIDQSLERKSVRSSPSSTRRFSTVGELLKNTVTVICNFIMLLLILSEFHFDLGPLIASAGVLGLAIGFGAQSLVKDVITGFFIILEDQFAVGDVIQTGSYKGTVEVIGLRTTRIIGLTGEVYIIPNGTITNVVNYSLSNAMAVVDVPVKMDQPLEETLSLISGAMQGIEERNPSVLAYPNILGIQSMTTAEYVIRVAAQTMPNQKEAAERQIHEDIKQALEQRALKQAEEAEKAKAEEEAQAQAEAEAKTKAEQSAGQERSEREAAAAQEEKKGEKNGGA